MTERETDLARIHEAAKRAALEVAQWPAWKKEASKSKIVTYESALVVAARGGGRDEDESEK